MNIKHFVTALTLLLGLGFGIAAAISANSATQEAFIWASGCFLAIAVMGIVVVRRESNVHHSP